MAVITVRDDNLDDEFEEAFNEEKDNGEDLAKEDTITAR